MGVMGSTGPMGVDGRGPLVQEKVRRPGAVVLGRAWGFLVWCLGVVCVLGGVLACVPGVPAVPVVAVVVVVLVRRWLGCSARLRANQWRHARPSGLFPTGTRCGFVGFRLVLDPGALLDPDAFLDPKGSFFVARSDTARACATTRVASCVRRPGQRGGTGLADDCPSVWKCGRCVCVCVWDVGCGMWDAEDGGWDGMMYGRL